MKVEADTWVNPQLAQIVLITNTRGDERRLWIVTAAQPDEPIEVEREFQTDLLRAMKVTLPGI